MFKEPRIFRRDHKAIRATAVRIIMRFVLTAACLALLATMFAWAQVPVIVRVNNPAQDNTRQDTQSETTIVLGTPPSIVVGFNDSGSNVGGVNRFTGFSLSTDGGNTFADLGTLPPGANGDSGDPVTARDNVTGRIFMATLVFTGSGMQVFRSFNNGAAFAGAINGAPGFGGGDFLDKEWIAVDNFPGAGQGNVYLVFRNFSGGAGGSRPQGIYITRSVNGGATWTPQGGRLIAPPANVQGAFVAVGPAHEVCVFWYETAGPATPAVIRMARSLNQGTTFGPAVIVATLRGRGGNGDLALNGGFRTESFPRAAINPVSGNLYVVFNDRTNGPDRGDIFFTRSANGGQTWTAPVRVNDDNTANDQWSPTLAVAPDGSQVFVGFYDRRLSPTNALIDYFGVIGTVTGPNVTFGTSFRLTSQAFPVAIGQDPSVVATYMGDYDQAVADNNFFYASWGDNRNANAFHNNQPDVFFARIPRNFVPPPGPPPPVPGPLAVFRCNQACPSLAACYGVGVLTTHPQSCSIAGPVPVPAVVSPAVATDTGLTVAPGATHVFRCNRACPSLGACYGVGVLTTHPQFCSIAGPVPAPGVVPATVATDTGLTVGAARVFRCNQVCPNLGACYGIGVLTTHPQFCSIAGPAPAPATVSPTLASDTGLRVP